MALDRPTPARERKRWGTFARLDVLSHVDVLHLVVAIDDVDVNDENVVVFGLQSDPLEAAFAASDIDDIAIDAEPADARGAQQLPITATITAVVTAAAIATITAVPAAIAIEIAWLC